MHHAMKGCERILETVSRYFWTSERRLGVDNCAVAIGKPTWYAATTWRCCSARPDWRIGPREAPCARCDRCGRRRHVVHTSSNVPQGHQCHLSTSQLRRQSIQGGSMK